MSQKTQWGLSLDEELFAIEYFSTKNATESYLKIKPHVKRTTAAVEACKLKDKKEVQLFLKHLMDTVRNDRIMTAEEVLCDLSEIARGNDSKMAEHQLIFTKDRVKALELMAKHFALLTEVTKQEIEHRVVIVEDLSEELGD